MLILNVNVGTRQCRFLIQIRGQKNRVYFNNLCLFTDIQRRNPVSGSGLRNRVSLDDLCHPTKIIIETRFLSYLQINLMVRYGAEKKLSVISPK